MNFIKKNIIFTIVVAVTLIGSLFLIYLDWTKHDAISAANLVTQDSQKKFDEAFRKGNKPVDLNIKMIQNDTEELKKRTANLQRIFGKPYRKALLNFAAALKVTEDDLYARMKKLFEGDTGTAKTADALVPKLFEELEKDKKLPKGSIEKNQFMKFVAEVFSTSMEKYESVSTGYDILGVALGLQRVMSPSRAHVYLSEMQSRIRSQRLIPGVDSLETVQNFTFNKFVQTFPSNEDVLDILETMPIFEDIFRRMEASRLERVENFQRQGLPTKINGDKYLCYNFSTTVLGTMDSIRNLLNNFLNAYKDNQVYVVTWVSMTSEPSSKEVEEVRNKLFGADHSQASPAQPADEPPRPGGPRRRSRKRRPGPAASPQIVAGRIFRIVSEEEAESQPDYGATVIGKDRIVRAVIRFKYYKFIGDRLKK